MTYGIRKKKFPMILRKSYPKLKFFQNIILSGRQFEQLHEEK
jgi:hypothetical protein